MVYQMETSRGGLKLVNDLNYIYRIDRKYGEKTYWKCDSMGCKARVHTKLEDDRLYAKQLASIAIFFILLSLKFTKQKRK